MTSSLLPPGSSALERRLAQACSGISDLNVPLRDLWNPWKCPAKFLPYLAWAFSVDRWEETWTETAKRQAVSDAFWIHQRKGTVAAVKRGIEGLGYSMTGDAKPVSRHISQLTLSASTKGVACVGVAIFDGEVTTVYPEGYTPDDSIYYDGMSDYGSNVYFTGK